MADMKESRQLKRENMMLSMPLPKVILTMAYPTIISFLINSIYSMADIYFVSSIGTNATAAVSVNSALDSLIMVAGSLFAVGASSYIARLLGAGNRKRAEQTLSTCFCIAFVLGFLIMLIGVSFRRPMVRLFGATETCEQYAIDYATYVLYAAPFMAASFVMNQCLRAEGSALYSMFGMGIGGVINCFLDPVFILPWGLNMGVAGASLATAISKLIGFVILIIPYLRGKSMLHLSIRNVVFHATMLKEVLSVGSSSMFRTLLSILSGILINKEAGLISDAALACIGVTNKCMMFCFSIILGFSNGFQPVAGFNWGARKYDRVRGSFRFASRTAFLGGLAMALITGIFAPQIIHWFSSGDAELIRLGTLCIRMQAIALPIHAWVAIVNSMAAGLGKARIALLLATARQGSCFIPVLYPLSRLFGAEGIASVQAVADVLTLALAIPSLISIRRMIREAEEQETEKTIRLEEDGS